MRSKRLSVSADFDPHTLPQSAIRQLEQRSIRELRRDVISRCPDPGTEDMGSDKGRPPSKPGSPGDKPASTATRPPAGTPGKATDARRTYSESITQERGKTSDARTKNHQHPEIPVDAQVLFRTYLQRPMVMKLVALLHCWSDKKISRLARRLVDLGLWSKGNPLGKSKSYALTQRGEAYARSLGIQPPKEKGSFVHQILKFSSLFAIEWLFPDTECRKSVAYHIGPDRYIEPDALILRPNGLRVALEACYKHPAADEASSTFRVLSWDSPLAPDYVLCAARDSTHMKAIERALDLLLSELNTDERDRARTRVRFTYMDDLLGQLDGKGKMDLSWLT